MIELNLPMFNVTIKDKQLSKTKTQQSQHGVAIMLQTVTDQ